jgi:hypothetical protein
VDAYQNDKFSSGFSLPGLGRGQVISGAFLNRGGSRHPLKGIKKLSSGIQVAILET